MDGYVDDMMCEGLFDNIEDLLDFSTDDEVLGIGDSSAPPSGGGGGGGGGAMQVAPAAVSTAAASFPSSDGEVCRVSATSDVCDEVNIHEDWITNFLDDSNFDIDFPAATGIIAAAAALPSNDYIGGNDGGNGNGNGKDDDSLFQSFSPVSVLDEPNNLSSSNDKGGSSSSSSSSSSTSSSRTNVTTAGTVSLAMAPVGPTMMLVPARARSKRPRRAAPAPANVAVPIVPPVSEGPPAVPTLLPECESFGESEPCVLPPIMKKKKKKNRHNFLAGNASGGDDTTAVRKCQHCGIQKTPQWRAGPTGPKTLCNACGVRYKSGRLFPEYRPAASPTFVPSIHSNSHKKVVEMRIKACQKKAANGMSSPVYPAAKNCDLLAYIRRRE